MPSFSIILPVRNGGDYLRECVAGILAQTHPDFDLLILDNNSKDGSLEWLKQCTDSRIKVYESDTDLTIEENWARIRHIEKREFITLIGHDDLLHPEYLSVMLQLIEKFPDASLYQAHFDFIDGKGQHIKDCMPMEEIQKADGFLRCQILQTRDSTGTGYMMRSRDYDALGGISPLYPNLIFADYELWMKLAMLSYIATSPKKCFSYRLHHSTSKTTNGEAYQDAFGRYMYFLDSARHADAAVNVVVQQHGGEMLLYFCRALSHRLLKTPRNIRTTTVAGFIRKCRGYADILIPGKPFRPLIKPGILIARLLDNGPGLFLFSLYKRFR